MKDKTDLVLLGFLNGFAWAINNMEPILKCLLLLISIGYAARKWWYLEKGKGKHDQDFEL